MTGLPSATAHRRILSLAAMLPVHRAFHWLHLHQPQLRHWLLEAVGIPAPPFGEQARAEWFRERFQALALENVHVDEEGNVLGQRSATATDPDAPMLLLSAHLDTVFPAGTVCHPVEDGSRVLAPGVCDNAAGLTALLAIAAALEFAGITPPIPILFSANVGEEGEGDLRGMRHLFTRGPYRDRIRGAIALEGGGSSTVVTRALGSLRLRVSVTGPGGHSWTDAGAPNPILLLSRALVEAASLPLPSQPRTTLNAGQISGGTSINSIPESATVLLDLRSTHPAQMRASADEIRNAMRETIAAANAENSAHPPAVLTIETIGERPAAALPDDSPLLDTVRAVDRHLGLRTETRIGSTDANLPLSLHIPAIALGGGGNGGGIHTLAEWYDPAGREVALRRILLTVLDTTQRIAEDALQPASAREHV
ncbi:MAG: M20/M25/M40 family metallo-hydrolase [Acidobacteriaceae bacterium]